MSNRPLPDPADAVYSHDVPAERPWSRLLKAGQTLRIVDLEGQQAVDALIYCAENPEERYSAQDTMRAPWPSRPPMPAHSRRPTASGSST